MYTELHAHTAFSLLDGASLPEEMADRAVELGYSAMAITDHDGLYGSMEFAQKAAAAGLFPITGAELTLTDESHITLLASSKEGYANLSKLITEAHRLPPEAIRPSRFLHRDPELGIDLSMQGIGKTPPQYHPDDRVPRLDPTLLASHAEGLILLTGCRQGKVSQLVDQGRISEAAELLRTYREWLGPENVFVELQHNLVYGDTQRVRKLVALANETGLGYVATGNVHYHVQDRHRLQDVLVAIKHRTTLDNSHQLRRPNAEFYLRSPQEMTSHFADLPLSLTTTLEIAERCRDFNLAEDLKYVFPDYDTQTGETPDEMLERVCKEAFAERYKASYKKLPEAQQRLDEELEIIAHHNLSGFFLLYRDLLLLGGEIADEVRGRSSARAAAKLPPGRGRGSSVSSIVCYLIGLSHIDPVKHDLFFGRFMNKELHSIPDIDLDFPREIRERLIERVYERYGHDHVGLVCAFSTYRLRSAVRDVGKALGLPLPELDKIAKLSEPHSSKELGNELARVPGYAQRKHSPPWCYLIELAEQLSHFPRHITQHVGGMIISSEPLSNLVPIQPAAMQGRFLCQWDKDSVEDLRAVKIDFLALGMLSLVEECLELIVQQGKEPIDLSQIDFDAPEIYDMIQRGDTIGVFQIESRAQIQMLPRTGPRTLDDLVVQVAIVRPGPIIGGAVKPYVAQRRQQRQFERTSFLPIEPHYDHDSLIPVLQETHGVVLYQEQVIQVAMELAGFTAGQADQLRRSMTRKRSREAMIAMWDEFREGAAERGVSREIARTVFKKLLGFAAYGFPKAHAVAFAVLAYQSCWLKYYHPAEFTCALLNNQPMGFYPPHVLTNDAKRHGLRVFRPDINLSELRCSVEEGNAIRIGLGYVQGMGTETARSIVIERRSNGDYQSLADFLRRVPLATEAVENLVMVGAFDGFGVGRREALWQIGLFIPSKRVGTPKTDKGRQLALALPIEQDQVALKPFNSWDRMAADYEIIGLSPHYHPLGLLRPRLPAHLATTADLEHRENHSIVQIAGLVVCRQRPGTAKEITFLLMEDELGLANIIVYPDLYQQNRLVVRGEPFLLVEGKLQREEGVINVIAHRIAALQGARSQFNAPQPDVYEDIFPETTVTREALSPASHNYR
ncbi:MAG: error-prone DNA polymerase [Thermomicrobiales bacterium]|nr:error-prone DNA polymerase [Thermomicrobiales bacterium]